MSQGCLLGNVIADHGTDQDQHQKQPVETLSPTRKSIITDPSGRDAQARPLSQGTPAGALLFQPNLAALCAGLWSQAAWRSGGDATAARAAGRVLKGRDGSGPDEGGLAQGGRQGGSVLGLERGGHVWVGGSERSKH